MQIPAGSGMHALRLARCLLALACAAPLFALPAHAGPLTVEARIPLGKVVGRIDHLAFDPHRRRLYVAELGNDSVGLVDLGAHRLIRTVAGFDEPQGVAYEPGTDTVYVANGGDGSVRIFSGADFAAVARITLASDADNVRVDARRERLYVGYGDGALAVLDARTHGKTADIPLAGHPESFQLDEAANRLFVNVPAAGQIAVVSGDTHASVATWPTGKLHGNFPLTLGAGSDRVIAVFRRPAYLQAFDRASGKPLAGIETCADADDVFADAPRRRLYVICGDGMVDVLDASGAQFTRVGRIRTSPGSRTGLFIPELDRLVVAIRAAGSEPAAVWVLRPQP